MRQFPFYPQHDEMDCGPACLQMVLAWFGRVVSLATLQAQTHKDRRGVSFAHLAEAAQAHGLESLALELPFEASATEAVGLCDLSLPCIVHWEARHFVVVYRIAKSWVYLADPARGKKRVSWADFQASWKGKAARGRVLYLEPGAHFVAQQGLGDSRYSLRRFGQLLAPFRSFWPFFTLSILGNLLLQVSLPFLTQAWIDFGLQAQALDWIALLLFAQFILFGSQALIRFLQSSLFLHLGARIEVQLLHHFFTQLLTRPLSFFEQKSTGDLIQRLEDNVRIRAFLTDSALPFTLSLINLLVFSGILLYYDGTIFVLFMVFSALYVWWILRYMPMRKQLDEEAFQYQAQEQQHLYEALEGIQSIKWQESGDYHKSLWLDLQAQHFEIRRRQLRLSQYQEAGALLLSRGRDLIISFLAAQAVVYESLSLGGLVAIQYIVAQLSLPFGELLDLIRNWQDARLSLQRAEAFEHLTPEKEVDEAIPSSEGSLTLTDVTFSYPHSPVQLTAISTSFARGSITALVGASGSGKTTLLKLIVGIYTPTAGRVSIGDTPISAFSATTWRRLCGFIHADSFIFSDSLLMNITGDAHTEVDTNLHQILHQTQLLAWIQTLPLGLDTKIGATGITLSQGQRQRLLLARALYNKPDFLCLDEMTQALDAETERAFWSALALADYSPTIIFTAHRLSSIHHAQQILVLEAGRIVEQGTHAVLLAQKGSYYTLIQGQTT